VADEYFAVTAQVEALHTTQTRLAAVYNQLLERIESDNSAHLERPTGLGITKTQNRAPGLCVTDELTGTVIQHPVWPSICSRMMSAWPAWRAVSWMTVSIPQRRSRRFPLRLTGAPPGATVMLMVDVSDRRPGVWTGHVGLRTRDTAVAARFYERIGMRPVEVGEHFAVLEMRGGTHLAIRYDPEHIEPGPVGWDLMVEDLDGAHDQWQAEGWPQL
jgi:hypothetical protein